MILTFLITPLIAWMFTIVYAMIIQPNKGSIIDEYLVILVFIILSNVIYYVRRMMIERRRSDK